MWFALLCFGVGFASALLSAAAALYLLFTAGRAKVRAGLEGERSRRTALLAHDSPKQPSAAATATKPEWTSSSDVELLRPGAAPARVALRAALPILFVLRPDGDERLGTVLLERCVVRVEKTTRKGRVRPRWHEDNALLLRARDGGDVFDGAAEVRLRFATGRELERWFCVCEQGCAAAEAGAAVQQHPQRHSRGEKGAAWREAFGALCHGLTEGGGGGASPPAAAVCANIALGKLLNFWRTREAFTGYIQKKINKQLAKVDPPKALKGQIRVVDVEIGNALPVLSDAALYGGGFAPAGAGAAAPARTPQTGGDFAVEADLLYTGGEFAVTLEIDFDVKVFDVSIPLPKVVARVQVTGVQGRLRAEFSSFSDYLWVAFVEEPRFDVRLVTDTPDLPLKILSRADIPELTELVVTALKTELIELMVYPRMEDLFLPLIHEEETEDATTAVVAGEEAAAATPASPASPQEQSAAPAVDAAAAASVQAASSAVVAEDEALPRAASSSVSTATSEGRHVRELGKKKVNAKNLFAGALHGGHAVAKAAKAAAAPPVVAAAAAAVEEPVVSAVVPPAVVADAAADEPAPTAVEAIQETLRGIHPMVDTALEVLPAVVKSLEESDAGGAVAAAAAAAATAVSDAAAAEEEESVTPSESAEDAAVAEVEAAAPLAEVEEVVAGGSAGEEEAPTQKAEAEVEDRAESPPSPPLPAASTEASPAAAAAAVAAPHRQPQWTQQPQWGDVSPPAAPVPVPVPEEAAPAAVTMEAATDEGKGEEEAAPAPAATSSPPSGPTYSNAAGLAAAFSSSTAADDEAEEGKKTVKVVASSLFKKAKSRARRVE